MVQSTGFTAILELDSSAPERGEPVSSAAGNASQAVLVAWRITQSDSASGTVS
jgi:hypothetical protein